MLALPEVVATLGANPDALLAEVGLSRAYFQDPENSLDVRTIGRLFGRAQEEIDALHAMRVDAVVGMAIYTGQLSVD